MKVILVIIIGAALSCGAYGGYSNQRQEAERTRAEEMRTLKEKNDALQLLKAYMDREERLLRGSIEETEKDEKTLGEDRNAVSEELRKISRICEQNERAARERNAKRYGKAEHAMLILKSPVLNALAEKYLGKDFSILQSECRDKIKSLIQSYRESSAELEKNRKQYEQSVNGLDDDVKNKTAVAKEKTMDANIALEKRLSDMVEMKNKKEVILAQLKRNLVSRQVLSEANRLRDEIAALDKEIARVQEVVNVSRASVAHIAATEAETSARRKGDLAVMMKAERDNAVALRESRENDIFLAATQYEARSLDALNLAMMTKSSEISNTRKKAKEKLDYIYEVTSNSDLLSVADLKRVQAQIAARLSDRLINVGNKGKETK